MTKKMKSLLYRLQSAFGGVKRHRLASFFLYSSFFILLAACNNDVPVIETTQNKPSTTGIDLAKTNQMLAQKENTEIDNFAKHHNLTLTDIGSGIKVMKTEEGRGPEATYDDTVIVRYMVKNIADVMVYENVEDTVVIGRLQPTRGLDMALRTLNEGCRAWVVLPSDQAYGVIGDGDLIGKRWILIYDLKVEKIKKLK